MSLFFPVVSFRIVKTNYTVQSNSSVNAFEKRNNERVRFGKIQRKIILCFIFLHNEKAGKKSSAVV